MQFDNEDIDISDTIEIESILNTLRKVNKYNSKIYYHGSLIDYYFQINEGAHISKLTQLKKDFKNLPDDYIKFLSLSNGISLQEYGTIYTLNEIYETKKLYDFYSKDILIIGDCFNSEVQIAIYLNKKIKNQIYVIDAINDDYFYSLNCNFTNFLNRFIISYGSDFWNWNKTLSNIPKIN